jgi:hypothetical protein
MAGFNRLSLLSWVMIQFAVVLMFLISNLVYLSLASTVMLVMFNIPQVLWTIRQGRLKYKGESKT